MALSALQERVAALVAALPESADFVLAGGAAMAAHDMLDRATRDLDYFARPDDAAAVQQFADAFEDAAKTAGLEVRRKRQAETFVRFAVRDGDEDCEVDVGIDYRALDSVPTRYGPALDLRELGADKVLAIFGRAEPRDFVDLAELTRRVPFDELVAVASEKDPGLDLAVLDQFMERVQSMRPESLGLDADVYRACRAGPRLARAHPRPPRTPARHAPTRSWRRTQPVVEGRTSDRWSWCQGEGMASAATEASNGLRRTTCPLARAAEPLRRRAPQPAARARW